MRAEENFKSDNEREKFINVLIIFVYLYIACVKEGFQGEFWIVHLISCDGTNDSERDST